MAQQPMILPKGIVLNSPDVYAEVARFPVVPPEKLYQYWHVYTTTFRRLIDPTAYRLENFWWHVWGSDRRYLSGAQLAQLFEEFSEGPTFVPLRGPPNRYEGPSTCRPSRNARPAGSWSGQQMQPKGVQEGEHLQEAETVRKSTDDSPDKRILKEPTPSSSRPPPSHPILKKPRGPSASGPRPTARFLVPESGNEGQSKADEEHGEEQVPEGIPEGVSKEEEESSESPVERESITVAMAPPPRPSQPKSEKKGTATTSTTRKFVASTSASKRRPIIQRRQSSQSSAGSMGSREGGAYLSSRYLGSSRSSRTTVLSEPKPKDREDESSSLPPSSSSSSSQLDTPPLSAKALGKRPARLPTVVSGNAAGQVDGPALAMLGTSVNGPPSTENKAPQATSQVNRTRHESPKSASPVAMFVADSQPNATLPIPRLVPPTMARSQSNQENRYRPKEMGRLPSQTLIASSVVATSTTTVQGKFDSDNITPRNPLEPEARDLPDQITLASRPSSSSLLELRFTPTQPNPTPAVPFGRSKSQLTLLLEREKDRLGDSRKQAPREP